MLPVRTLATAFSILLAGFSTSAAEMNGIAALGHGVALERCLVTTSGSVMCWGAFPADYEPYRTTPVPVPGLSSGVVAIADGNYKCVLTTARGVKCQSVSNPAAFEDIPGLGSGVHALVTGSAHACALMDTTQLKCWGDNSQGQFGNGNFQAPATYTTPVDALGGARGIIAVAAGPYHMCAAFNAGNVKCWGLNLDYNGYVIDGRTGSTNYGYAVVDVAGVSGATGVAAGENHSCAIVPGGVKCWGANGYGQLGDDSTVASRASPADVIGLPATPVAIQAGSGFTCALMGAGDVMCWGNDTEGQLGDGSLTSKRHAVATAGLSNVASLGVGSTSSCALLTNGTARCWGSNSMGQVGDGANIPRKYPRPPLPVTDVQGLSSGVSAISSGGQHACAITASGTVKCWGSNQYGYVGDGSTVTRYAPVDVQGLSGVVKISTGPGKSCALTTAGAVKCWGQFPSNPADPNPTFYRTVPGDVPGLTSGALAIAAGNDPTSCAVNASGAGVCWGYLPWNGSTVYTATVVPGLESGIVDISVGDERYNSAVCALTAAGGVKCIGRNDSGQLGRGDTNSVTTAGDVVGLASGVAGITVGARHACALTTAGGIKCWGDNRYGQLGDGTNLNWPTPRDVVGLATGAASVSAGGGYTCAATTSGIGKCWGDNSQGEFGGGSAASSNVPVDIVGLPGGIARVSAGDQWTTGDGHYQPVTSIFVSPNPCALATSGAVKCWGPNYAGELGDGLQAPRTTPVALQAGSWTSMAVWHVARPTEGTIGKDMVFDVAVANGGQLPASNVVLTYSMYYLSFVWAAPGCSLSGYTLTCNIGDMRVGETRNFRFVGRPSAQQYTTYPSYTCYNTAQITASGSDPSIYDSKSDVCFTLRTGPVGTPVPRYRLYSNASKEHHFTTDLNEYNVLGASGAWVQEGTVGKVLDNPGSFNGIAATPYYRLYNTITLWHHWTTDPNEYYTLITYPGWNGEGVDGYLLPSSTTGATQLYRLTYPYIGGLHHWTIDRNEYDTLISTYGWVGEGGSGFVIQ